MNQRFHAISTVLLVTALLFSLPGSAQASANSSLQLAPASNNPDGLQEGQSTYIVFYDQTFTYTYFGGPICLSGQDGQCSQPAIDDAVIIYVNGNKVVDHVSYATGFGPIDFSPFLQIGNNQIRVQLIDLLGPTMGGSALWLVPSDGPTGPCEGGVGLGPISFPVFPELKYTRDYLAVYASFTFGYELEGTMCPDLPISISEDGGDPSVVLRSGATGGEVTVHANGALEVENPINRSETHTQSWKLSPVPPILTLSYKDHQKIEANALDFTLNDNRSVGIDTTIKRPPEQYVYVVAVFTAAAIIVFVVPEAAPAVAPAVRQMLLKVPAPLMVAPLGLQQQERSRLLTPQATSPAPSSVISDLASIYGSEAIGLSTVDLLGVDNTIKGPGQNISYNASGFTPNGRVYVTLNLVGDPSSSVEIETRADNAGNIAGKIRLPITAKAGNWVLSAVDIDALYNSLSDFVNGNPDALHAHMAANTITIPTYKVVKIDIKPGSKKNPINLKSHGVIPVAILSTKDFKAKLVDPITLQFGPNAAPESHRRGHGRDANGDGKQDLMLHFRTQLTGIVSTDTKACIFGQLTDGTYIFGCDKITIVPK